jgi:hypothetical protein
MSAFPLKADITENYRHVRLVPKADAAQNDHSIASARRGLLPVAVRTRGSELSSTLVPQQYLFARYLMIEILSQ